MASTQGSNIPDHAISSPTLTSRGSSPSSAPAFGEEADSRANDGRISFGDSGDLNALGRCPGPVHTWSRGYSRTARPNLLQSGLTTAPLRLRRLSTACHHPPSGPKPPLYVRHCPSEAKTRTDRQTVTDIVYRNRRIPCCIIVVTFWIMLLPPQGGLAAKGHLSTPPLRRSCFITSI